MRIQRSDYPGELHIPVPGYWYINSRGKLMQVRFVTYAGQKPQTVLIQYIEGTMQRIDIDDWHCLDIVTPCEEQGEQRRKSEIQP